MSKRSGASSTCHCANLRRVAMSVTRVYDRALAGSGLKVTQYSLLKTVARLEAPNLVVLAAEMGLDRSTLGRNARVLAREGFVHLSEGRDERTTVVTLTEAGRAAIDAAAPLWDQAQRRIDAELGEDGRAMLETLVQRIGAAAAGDRKS